MIETIFSKASDLVINLVSAAIILMIGAILGKALGRTISAFLKEIELNRFTENDLHLAINFEEYAGIVISYVCYVISLHLALNTMHLTKTAFYAAFIGIALLVGFSLAISIRDFFPNLFAGMQLREHRAGSDGKPLKYENMAVHIEHIGIVETRIRTKRNDILFVPNAEMEKNLEKKSKKE